MYNIMLTVPLNTPFRQHTTKISFCIFMNPAMLEQKE